MKRSLVGIMAGLAVATAMDANAAKSDAGAVDKEAGTVSREVETSARGGAPLRETLSCKYAYINISRGDSTHNIDLLAGLNGPKVNEAAEKRLAVARALCSASGLKPEF